MNDDLFTAEESAAEVGVAVNTIYSWVARGWLAHAGRRGRLKLFRLSDVFECEKTRTRRIPKQRAA
jgi:predicted site-specific integrase-resolvase